MKPVFLIFLFALVSCTQSNNKKEIQEAYTQSELRKANDKLNSLDKSNKDEQTNSDFSG